MSSRAFRGHPISQTSILKGTFFATSQSCSNVPKGCGDPPKGGGRNLPPPLVGIGLTYLSKDVEACLQGPFSVATALLLTATRGGSSCEAKVHIF